MHNLIVNAGRKTTTYFSPRQFVRMCSKARHIHPHPAFVLRMEMVDGINMHALKTLVRLVVDLPGI